jgi:cysteine sulfinate desulfinase/cysteine desulfurase-like protein
MSLSAHKLYGPRGVGALYIRSGRSLPPLLVGGGQERGMRAGTENTPAICGFDLAAQMASDDMFQRMEREKHLLDAFAARLKACGVMQLGDSCERLPGVTALLLPGISSEQAIAALDLRGVMIAGGAACASHSGRPSHVYTAMGLSDTEAACVIRVSIGRHTTADQALISGQVGLDTSYQLTGTKRLGNIVIGAQTQATDLINILFLGGNHQNGGILYLADPLADLKAIHTGQHQIQNK